MKKTLLCIAVVALPLAIVACGGGGGGGENTNPYPLVDISQFDPSQSAALRDMGLYDFDNYSADEAFLPIKSLGAGSLKSPITKTIGLMTKEAINESGQEVENGLNNEGSLTMDYSIQGDAGQGGGHITGNFIFTAEDFHYYGKCGQTVYYSGVIKCDIDMSAASNRGISVLARCYTEAEVPLNYTGADEIGHTVAFEYKITLTGKLNYDDTITVANLSVDGWAAVDNASVSLGSLGEAPACPAE